MKTNNLANPHEKLFPSQPNPRIPFRIYRRAPKEIWNDREFQLAKKRHIKAFSNIKCQGFRVTMANVFCKDEIQLSKLKSLIKILRHNKSLLSLKLPIQTIETFHVNIILPHLKHLRALSNFTLELTDTRFITSKIHRFFALSAKNLKQLTHLNHNIYQNLQRPSKSLKTFRHFPTLRHLSNLSLSFDSTKTLTDQSFRPISSHLSRLSSLTSLSLNLSNIKGLTRLSLSHLFSSISLLSLLTAFSLQFCSFQTLDSHLLIELFQRLRNLPSLQELALSLSLCTIPRIPEQQEPLTAGLPLLNPSSLRRIYLDFYSDFSDSDLSNLLIVLQQFPSLTHLQLGFNQTPQITGRSLSNLHETLINFPFLTHFSFEENCQIDVSLALNSLSLCLNNLKHLQSLKINTYNNESLNNLVIQDFSTKLYQLSRLRYLYLNFKNCQKLLDRSLESIAFALRGLENLESLHLSFEMIREVTNQGAMALGSSIAQLKSLKNLQLKLGYCPNIGGEDLRSLTASLKRLNYLNEIYLTFGSFKDKSGSENYEDLVRVVSRLETLRKIYLGIPKFGENKYCDQIAEKASTSSKNFTIYWI